MIYSKFFLGSVIMADSDDDYDNRRKGREKFRRERNDYERREDRRGRDPREVWDRDRSTTFKFWFMMYHVKLFEFRLVQCLQSRLFMYFSVLN